MTDEEINELERELDSLMERRGPQISFNWEKVPKQGTKEHEDLLAELAAIPCLTRKEERRMEELDIILAHEAERKAKFKEWEKRRSKVAWEKWIPLTLSTILVVTSFWIPWVLLVGVAYWIGWIMGNHANR